MPDPTSTREPLGVVGAGRLGSVLAAAWRAAGYPIAAVSARSAAARGRAAALLPGVPVVTEPAEVLHAAAVVLIAVPDDALPGVVAGLAPSVRPGQAIVHGSGAAGLAVLSPLAGAGAVRIALHPAMTFTGTADDLPRLAGCPFAITADEPARALAERLVTDLGGRPVWLAEQQRVAYHAALCHGANHLVTLVAQAQDVLAAAGIDDPSALLRPLLEAVLANALRLGDEALTGPVSRGDAGTVHRHLDALAGIDPAIARTYRDLAFATAVRAAGMGRIDAAQLARLTELLGRD